MAWLLLGGAAFLCLYLYTYRNLEAQTPKQPPPSETPSSPAEQAKEEQYPVAIDYLPKTKLGYVDWVEAIKKGVITPRGALLPTDPQEMPPINFDVLFRVKAEAVPNVVFPHLPHTLWLDCRNCHPSIFKMQAGTNPITMEKILRGEFCGRCHGTVAFPISDCLRCHSRPK